MYNSIKIGRQSRLINLTLKNAFLRKAVNKSIIRRNHAHMHSDQIERVVFVN